MVTSLKRQYESSPLHGANAPYVEALYEAYLNDPESVSSGWREYFATLHTPSLPEKAHGPIVEALGRRLREPPRWAAVSAASPTAGGQASEKQAAVSRLIQVYSLRGHQIADLDPLGLWQRHTPAVLRLDYLGIDERDLDQEFYTGGLAGTGHARMRLRDIIALLKWVYCGKIGAEFAHLSRARERLWLRERFEADRVNPDCNEADRRAILASLSRAEGIERYLNTKYVGQKRFSLEGGETLIPMLDDLIQRAGSLGTQEIVIGMAHRGRLNVLVNVLGKSPEELFSEFEGVYDPTTLEGSGDVKYHMGFSADVQTSGGNVHVALAFNPSHLEIVDPVVEGSVRARQDRRGDTVGDQVVPVLIHGDAAVAGQGVVAETLQLSQTRDFYTGGTIHVIVNNQIGFTASEVRDLRSTMYCSDVAKMIEAPVLHVNGDDPEAAVVAMRLALRYRQAFHKDVVIDLVCYRRLGHNEADEPAATQPVMYRVIRKHPTVRTLYGQKLLAAGLINAETLGAMAEEYRNCLDSGQSPNPASLGFVGNQYTVDWTAHGKGDLSEEVVTAVPAEQLNRLSEALTTVPADFKLHPRVQRIVDDRKKMAEGVLDMDWGFAESLAYASLLAEDRHVRLIGQDSRRGTFFHRHAALFNQHNGDAYVPLAHVAEKPNAFTVADSLLSEEAVLAFRVRLQHYAVRLFGDLGGPVRGLRQRRPGGHRSVHQLRGGEMGTALGIDAVLAPRLRRSGAGAFLGSVGALFAALRGTQYAGLRSLDPSSSVSPAASSDAAVGP